MNWRRWIPRLTSRSLPRRKPSGGRRVLRLEALENRLVPASLTGDFNGDKIADLVVGIPTEDIGNVIDAGAIAVLYGSTSGLKKTGVGSFSRSSFFAGEEAFDNFGAALAAGNFNGDKYDDLAIGIPGAIAASKSGAGMIVILFGSSSGLRTTGWKWFTQDTIGGETSEKGDHFGAILVAGDFNADGKKDLAVGVPDEDVGSTKDAGIVQVLPGSSSGLTKTGAQIWRQGAGGLGDTPEANDRFGAALAVGDFNGNGKQDLAVGVPGEGIGVIAGAGAVQVLYGNDGVKGLTSAGNQLWTQDSPNIEGGAETGDHFGAALAAGDFDGNHRDDLAVGVPDEDLNGKADAGGVNVIYGNSSSTGLTSANDQFWSQDGDAGNLIGAIEAGDHFGKALAAGDFNGDGKEDLAVGVPGEDITVGRTTYNDAGTVNVLYGSSSRLSDAGNQVWDQDVNLPGDPEAGDGLGATLITGDFDGNGKKDLAIGVPNEAIGSKTDSGEVHIVYGTSASKGLTTTGNTEIYQTVLSGFAEEEDDHFGGALG